MNLAGTTFCANATHIWRCTAVCCSALTVVSTPSVNVSRLEGCNAENNSVVATTPLVDHLIHVLRCCVRRCIVGDCSWYARNPRCRVAILCPPSSRAHKQPQLKCASRLGYPRLDAILERDLGSNKGRHGDRGLGFTLTRTAYSCVRLLGKLKAAGFAGLRKLKFNPAKSSLLIHALQCRT